MRAIRNAIGGALVIALLAPVFLPATGSGARAPERSPGGSCCVAAHCCDTGGGCAAGGCDRPGSGHGPASTASASPRLTAGCSGPAPAVPAVDRDPMIAATALRSPAPAVAADPLSTFALTAPERSTDLPDPPPRA